MFRRRNYLLIAVVLVLSLALVGCGKKETADSGNGNEPVSDDNVLRVGMECGYAPYNWTQSDDLNGAVKIEGSNEYAGGYDVEIAKKVAEALGKELLIVKIEWDGLPPAVQSDKIDLIMAGMSPTADRKEQIDFTTPYWVSEYVMIVQGDSEYANATTLEDFAGAKITGQLNTVHYDIIDQIEGVVKEDAREDFPQMRVALQSGVIDGYVGEMPEADSVAIAMPEFASIRFTEGNGFVVHDNENTIAAGVKKGSDLTDKISEVFDTLTEEDRQAIMDEAIKNQPVAN